MPYELDHDHIEAAAHYAAKRLTVDGDPESAFGEPTYAHVRLTPGDGTVYPIVVVAPHGPVFTKQGMVIGRSKEYLVVLASDFGNAYAWTGQSGMHADYCGEKWARSSFVATGNVMAEFLNALAAELALATAE